VTSMEKSGTDGFIEGGKDIFDKAKGIAVDKNSDGPTEMFVLAFDGVGETGLVDSVAISWAVLAAWTVGAWVVAGWVVGRRQ